MPGPSVPDTPRYLPAEQPGCLGLLARLVWLLVGNVALLVVLVLVVERKSFSFLDAIFWAIVAVQLFIRYADLKWLKGLGADAQPATKKDWGRYAKLLLIIAGGAWVIAHALLLLLRH